LPLKELDFRKSGIDELADVAIIINRDVENIGARRLHTILEKLLEDISFSAPEKKGEKVIIDKEMVSKNLGDIVKGKDLSNFIL